MTINATPADTELTIMVNSLIDGGGTVSLPGVGAFVGITAIVAADEDDGMMVEPKIGNTVGERE